ncbi:antigen 5 like allergen Cul n 1-like [Teleopsis dalmanni]|uniref:antigen 5 like allergen Cul n 1-like n=1 Tax=Teleopsis dalmanni TaxID=139649 RepID=UPI0018CE474D|nr:antigen 5 like allergen Cul n 1-like [Teleopsis dalmanni]XP_037932311.1 antigen 5 like allergen Cul n 1-like [Teleopsis dalmanni]
MSRALCLKLIGVFSFALLIELTLSTNYCSSTLCKSGATHIACNNNGAFASACSSDAKIVPMTAALKKALLNKHNTLRNTIASGKLNGYKAAKRMATIVWDAELAKLAELNVKQCVMNHDECRNTDKFKFAGQNLAYSGWSGTTKTVQSVAVSHVQLWYNEYKDCSMSYINSYKSPTNGKAIGHFTQVVQEKATHMGCAILRQTKSGTTYQFIACDYAYTNVLGKPIYTSGTAASGCKTGRNPNFKSLCTTKEVYNVNS